MWLIFLLINFIKKSLFLINQMLFYVTHISKMATRELARKLNALEIIKLSQTTPSNLPDQPYNYLLVLDFEATCWEKPENKKYNSEIIEFPVVLYDVKKGEITAEFQKYVKPTENPNLSPFCTELTGITQVDVNNGVSLLLCLALFKEWLKKMTILYNLDFSDTPGRNKCIFLTWSDWDLGTCLKKEFRRKRIPIDDIFRKWIDIRALYKLSYIGSFKGLSGALSAQGLTFQGNQHCGLHDARNTAHLAEKMINDGIILKETSKI